MEKIKSFVEYNVNYGYGYGNKYSNGDEDARGFGYCCEDEKFFYHDYINTNNFGVNGYGDINGNGYGHGSAHAYYCNTGYDNGNIYGEGDGKGYISIEVNSDSEGYGYGNGYGITEFCGEKVYIIDDTPTIINQAENNIAVGSILNNDLTLTPCYIVKQNGVFAHGKTLYEAKQSLDKKLLEVL